MPVHKTMHYIGSVDKRTWSEAPVNKSEFDPWIDWSKLWRAYLIHGLIYLNGVQYIWYIPSLLYDRTWCTQPVIWTYMMYPACYMTVHDVPSLWHDHTWCTQPVIWPYMMYPACYMTVHDVPSLLYGRTWCTQPVIWLYMMYPACYMAIHDVIWMYMIDLNGGHHLYCMVDWSKWCTLHWWFI